LHIGICVKQYKHRIHSFSCAAASASRYAVSTTRSNVAWLGVYLRQKHLQNIIFILPRWEDGSKDDMYNGYNLNHGAGLAYFTVEDSCLVRGKWNLRTGWWAAHNSR